MLKSRNDHLLSTGGQTRPNGRLSAPITLFTNPYTGQEEEFMAIPVTHDGYSHRIDPQDHEDSADLALAEFTRRFQAKQLARGQRGREVPLDEPQEWGGGSDGEGMVVVKGIDGRVAFMVVFAGFTTAVVMFSWLMMRGGG